MINFTYMHTLISFSLLRVRRLFEKALISTMGKTLREYIETVGRTFVSQAIWF